MLVATHHLVRFFRIDIWIVEQSHLELPEKHGRNQIVELRFLEHALLHKFHQVQIAVRIGQLNVDARFDRQLARFLFVLSDKVAVRVRPVSKLPDRVVIRYDKSLETPLLAQHIAQQPLIRMGRHAIDLVV